MDKKNLILAKAGSGKTYLVVQEIDENQDSIIIAFTNENIFNINKELFRRFGYIPTKIRVMTFHKFVYNYFIRPFDKKMGISFGIGNNFRSLGVDIKTIPVKDPRKKHLYVTQDNFNHYYIDKTKRYYSSRLSKFVLKSKECNLGFDLFYDGIERLSFFVKKIYIDEFQDFRQDDYKLLEKIISKVENIFLVGDYYQHSVSALNNSGLPFKKNKEIISYDEYIKNMQKLGLSVDKNLLICSRRCSEEVCDFINDKLLIDIKSKKLHKGNIIFVKNKIKALNILKNNEIMKLVHSNSKKYKGSFINYGYSKGNTYKKICVILTGGFEKLDTDNFNLKNKIISPITINQLYVALTRSSGDVFILKKSIFDQVKNEYKIYN